MGCIFVILELTKGMNSGSLTISGRGQEHIMQQYKEWENFCFGVELCANFLIDAYKSKSLYAISYGFYSCRGKGTWTMRAKKFRD